MGYTSLHHPLTGIASAKLNTAWLNTAGGFGVGDVITGINERKVTKAADLALALDSFQVGDRVSLKVRRGEEGAQVGCCHPLHAL